MTECCDVFCWSVVELWCFMVYLVLWSVVVMWSVVDMWSSVVLWCFML